MDVLPDTCGRRRVKHLLLMFLFVMKAAADCSKPQRRDNIVLTNEALLKNAYPENDTVTLECANGYVKESGSGVITCTGGNWTEPDLICNKKDCGPPPVQPHMKFDMSGGTLFGAEIGVSCDEGYELSGTSYKQCYAHGWDGNASCDKVICDPPPEVPNGRKLWGPDKDPEYGDIIQYECNEGYTLVGKENITCTETGEFDSEPPECKGVTTDGGIINTVTPTPRPPATEPSTSTAATSTAHRDKTFTPGATPTVSPSPPGGRGILTAEESATSASVTSTTQFEEPSTSTAATSTAHRDKTFTPSATPSISPSPPGKHGVTLDTNKDVEYTPVIVSVLCVVIVVLIVLLFLYKYLLRRKGFASGTELIH